MSSFSVKTVLEYSGSIDVNPDHTFVINTTAGIYIGAAALGCGVPIPLCLYRPR